MAANTKKFRLKWSDRTYTLPEVVKNVGIPVLVKIDESIYELTDERFSPGDLLQIHCKESVTKVVCRVLKSVDGSVTPSVTKQKQKGTLEETDISIPVDCKRKLTIHRRDAGIKVYQNVSQLIEEFPRYVRLIDTFTDNRGYTISAKSDIELGHLEKGGLSCVCDGYTYNLSRDQQIKCLLLSDNTEYTLQELRDRYPLPQTVKFSQKESPVKPGTSYSGVEDPSIEEKIIQIKSVMKQDVYVCTLNPFTSSQASNSEKGKQGSQMVVIPSDSIAISQLEMKIPQEPEDNNYGMILTKISPKTEAAMTIINETIDTVNYPKVLFIPIKKDKKQPTPPVPSRPVKRTPSKQQQASPQPTGKGHQDDNDDSDYEPIGPQKIPTNDGTKLPKPKPINLPKPKTNNNKAPPSKDEVNDPSLYAKQPQEVFYEDEDDHLYDEIKDEKKASRPGRRRKSESDSVESTLAKVPTKVKESLLKVQSELRTFWKTQIASQASDTEEHLPEKEQGKATSLQNKSGTKTTRESCKVNSIQDPGLPDSNEPAKQGKGIVSKVLVNQQTSVTYRNQYYTQDSSYTDIFFDENDSHSYTVQNGDYNLDTVPETPREAGEIQLPKSHHKDDAFGHKTQAIFSKLKLKEKVQALKSKIETKSVSKRSDVSAIDYTNRYYIISGKPLEKPLTETPLEQKVEKIQKDMYKSLSKPKSSIVQHNDYTVQKPGPQAATFSQTETQKDAMKVIADDNDYDYVNVENDSQKNTKTRTIKDEVSKGKNDDVFVSRENETLQFIGQVRSEICGQLLL